MCTSLRRSSWPRAILHVDGDAFFASCEQALHPEYRGKPVVTGKERNIVAAASYEAKALGVQRGVALWDAKKMCPDLVVLPSDYETYSLFSKRMFSILRRYTPDVEEYSVDEAFADLTGLRRYHRTSYRGIAERIQADIHGELGITVSIGVSLSKTLAKLASKRNKPAGLTVISGRHVPEILAETPLEKVWNIGPNTAALLQKHGLTTALDFALKDEHWVSNLLTKPGVAIWHELNGRVISPLYTEEKSAYQSISKFKTFTPPSADRAFVFSQLMKNLENACSKARRHGLAAKRIVVLLRRQNFSTVGLEAGLHRPSAFPLEIGCLVRALFDELFDPRGRGDALYRSTGVVLVDLVADSPRQVSLFESPLRVERLQRLYGALDSLRDKYGKHKVTQGCHPACPLQPCAKAGLPAVALAKAGALRRISGSRSDIPWRKTHLLKGETKRQRLALPVLGRAV